MALGFSETYTLFAVFVLVVCIFVYFIVRLNSKKNQNINLTPKDRKLRKIILVFNIIWCILFIPSVLFSYGAAAATIMMTDSGGATTEVLDLIIYATILFFTIPISVIASIFMSNIYRKKQKYVLSILIQLTPIAIALLAFLFLAISFSIN